MFPTRGALRDVLAEHFYDWPRAMCRCGWRPTDADGYVSGHLEHLATQLEACMRNTGAMSPDLAPECPAHQVPLTRLSLDQAPGEMFRCNHGSEPEHFVWWRGKLWHMPDQIPAGWTPIDLA